MSLQQMYPAKNNSPRSFLTAAVEADSTSMTLDDASVLPPITEQNPVNLFVLGTGDDAEIVSYSAINGNVVSGIVRGINGTIAAAWPANTIVARNFTAQDAEAFRLNILDLDERKTDKSYVDTGLAGKSDTSHTHDERYYTESEVDTALNAKANSASPSFTGTPTFDNATAWLTALGLSDSGWQTLPNTNNVYTGTIRYRSFGPFVYVQALGLLLKSDLSNINIALDQLPLAYRPAYNTSIFAGNASNPSTANILAVGDIYFFKGAGTTWSKDTTISFTALYIR